MKSILLLLIITNIYFVSAQNNNSPFVYNRINIIVPSNEILSGSNKIINNETYIYVDFNSMAIRFATFYSDGLVTNDYRIDNVSDLINNSFYRLTCTANNYSEIIVEIQHRGEWIRSTVTHNGISHLYYNN